MTSSEKYGLHVNVREIALKEETRLKLVQKKTAEVAKLLLILPVNFAGTSLCIIHYVCD
jgi:hypothetical protein